MFEQFEIEDNLIIENRNSKEMKVEEWFQIYLQMKEETTT